MKTIVLDAGHGAHDSGAVSPHTGALEKDLNLEVVMLMRPILERAGVRVLLTRDDDTFVELFDRRAFTDTHEPDLFLSIHCNSADNQSASGAEAWTSIGQTAGDRFATTLGVTWQDDVPLHRFRPDDSDGDLDREANFAVLMCNAPACLFELGFLSNEGDSLKFANLEWVTRAATSLASGVMLHLGLTEIPAPIPTNSLDDIILSLDKDIHRLQATREKLKSHIAHNV